MPSRHRRKIEHRKILRAFGYGNHNGFLDQDIDGCSMGNALTERISLRAQLVAAQQASKTGPRIHANNTSRNVEALLR